MILVPFFTNNFNILLIYLVGIVILAYSANLLINLMSFLTRIILPFLLLLFAMQSILYPGGKTILYSFYFISIKKEGILFASLIGIRLLIAVSSLLLTFMATSPKNIVAALEEKGMSSNIGFVIISTLQIVPQMRRQSQKILDAQKSRGVEAEGNIWQRVKAYIPIIAPLILSSISQLEQRALALEARAFSAPVKKTSMIEFDLSRKDKIFRGVIYLIAIFAIVYKVVILWH